MRTLTTAIVILGATAALFGSLLPAEAKGPFRAEISGGDLTEPVTIDGPLSADLVFQNQALTAKPAGSTEPAYTIKLMPADPARENFVITMTYFPGEGDRPALIRGEWDTADHYFPASDQFQSIVDNAIGRGSPTGAPGDGDDGVSAVWYIAPSLAAVGLLVAGGLAGRRLLFRHDE